jgi:hypothetical protein
MGCRWEVEKRLEALEQKAQLIPSDNVVYLADKPKLSGALVLVGTILVFCTGCFLHWHWGWLIAIGVLGGSPALSMLLED